MASKRKKRKLKVKMGRHVSPAEAERMFRFWCEHQNCAYVAGKCGRSETTVYKHRKAGNWPKRLKAIQAKAQKKTDHDTAEMIARQTKMFREIEDVARKAVKRHRFNRPSDKTSDAAHAAGEAAKQERTLLGEPTERIEFTDTLQERYARRKQAPGNQG